MPLKTYQQKRNFKKTTEPSGRPAKKAAKKSRKKSTDSLTFVVQEHHASHLHYDFRLEWRGVLKSWAVPKGPSKDPKVKRLAVEVEDHPLDYGQFEGTIPKGEYGGGDVYIWDKGLWIPQGDVAAAFKKGHLEFELKGHKLKGRWDLIRTKRAARSPQWLLFKRSDKYAEPGHDAELQGRPWKKASSASASRSLPLSFVAPELAQLVSEPPEGEEWLHETKFDGYRMQAHLMKNSVQLISRTDHDWSQRFPTVLEALQKFKSHGTLLDGELVWLDSDGRSNFQRLQNAIKSSDHSAIFYYVFDILFLEGKDLRQKPLLERKKILQGFLTKMDDSGPLRFSEHIQGHARTLFQEVCRLQLEGLISKRAESPYLSGRNNNWQKIKCGQRQEFVIGGYNEGKGNRGELGALLLGVYENGQLRYVGKTGTGFTEKSLKEMYRILKPLEQRHSPFAVGSPQGAGLHWVKPLKVAEVSFANWTEGGHLRVAVFQGLREDKKPMSIHVEKPQAEAFTLSHPDKVIYAKEKLTKKDLAQFYQEISAQMLPYLADRPLSLLRCPEGTSKDCFFQKHFTGSRPTALEEVLIAEKKGPKPYVTLVDAAGLTALVQIGAFEIHCWNCHRDKVEYPDQIVMDFDPGPGVPWSQVIAGAEELKSMLGALRLQSYVKLTGGKGLHVHIPVKAKYNWEEVRAFAKVLADEMVSRNPDLYVAKMSKKLRQKKIFVDYLRNGRGATAVAPYSLRARPRSAVAMPLTWAQLKKTTGSDIYTLKKALSFLKRRKKDPWQGYLQNQQVIKLLEKPSQQKKSRASLSQLSL